MSRSTEAEINKHLEKFWRDNRGQGRAPTLFELWQEQERVAEMAGGELPSLADVREHFAWFFGVAG